jgi:hypothetical protein
VSDDGSASMISNTLKPYHNHERVFVIFNDF